ncbi:hypothetical protein COT48_02060 [Candidatus Woesearchaeota archaeon CG08_land_8_20_14_0_20_47_9]|nr:MAG: hypothetical protein COT48_02060 [Candidatus Woesearchaeota archaeon CG08_land_8_20_14_0_20_47_9]
METDKLGKVAVAGDVFWWADKQKQKTDRDSLMSLKDPYVKDREELMKGRKKLLEVAAYIIPGHGKAFWVRRLASSGLKAQD